jgi:glycosyltransferase involved in cell wall biosynthesis
MLTRPCGVALLTNFIPPYRLPIFSELANSIPGFTVWTDVEAETDRLWAGPETRPSWVRRIAGLSVPRHRRLDAGRDLHLGVLLPIQLILARPKVVISGELGMRSLSAALYTRTTRDTRLVAWLCLSEHTERHRGLLRTSIRSWLLRSCDEVVVHSASAKRYVKRLHPGAKVVVVPQATDRPVIAPHELRRSQTAGMHLVFVGAVTPRKNLPWLIAALDDWLARQTTKTNVVLTVAGAIRDGDLITASTSLLTVRYLGDVPYAKVSSLLRQCDALIHPSKQDEWGLAVNEALCHGLPVLGSVYSEAVNELIEDGVNGFRFNPQDPNTFSHAMDRLSDAKQDPSRWREMQVAALATAEDASMTRMVAAFCIAIRGSMEPSILGEPS